MAFADFLQAVPAGQVETIDSAGIFSMGQIELNLRYSDPIQLQCYGEDCGGLRRFSPTAREHYIGRGNDAKEYSFQVTYRCRDCRGYDKVYSLMIWDVTTEASTFSAYKFGELPPFSIHVSAKLRELLEPDSELLDKALASEAAGLGIGAAVYYRRILENQKIRIFDHVIAAAKKLGAAPEVSAALEKAKNERHLTKSLDALGSGPLKAIYLNGHNPLTLLYDEVSDGVHAGSDADNLSSAHDIRIVLMHLADQLSEVTAERAELQAAVNDMLKKQAERNARRKAAERTPPV